MIDESAKSVWERENGNRQAVLDRARECSRLTIPGLLPPQGHTEQTPLPTPFQSIGAKGVTTLASKLMLALLPPGLPFFRFKLRNSIVQELKEAGTYDDVLLKLSSYEQEVTEYTDGLNVRPLLIEALKHLIVVGDVLVSYRDGTVMVYRIDQYVVVRTPDGKPVLVVVREQVHPKALKRAVRIEAEIPEDHKSLVDVFTMIEWDEDGRVYEQQQINGRIIADSQADYPRDRCPWLPLRWQAVPNHNYGRSLCEEYLGDLVSTDGLSESIISFAAVAAKILFLVAPASSTDFKEVTAAASGTAIQGRRADIEVLQLEKFADFRVAKETLEIVDRRISEAFLIRAGSTRDAERVTAEEIKLLAQELEDVLGGTYTVLGSELMLPFARLTLADMERAGELPSLPASLVKPAIVTGFEAIGRNHSVNRLRSFLGDLGAVDPTFASIKLPVVSKRLAVGHGVSEPETLIKSAEEMQEEQRQAQVADAASRAAPGIATAATKAYAEQPQ